MKFYFYYCCFSIPCNRKSVLPYKAYRKLRTLVVEGCQKRYGNLIHHGFNCPGRCHRKNISLKRKVFYTGHFVRSTTCCNASTLQSILSAQLLRHRIACGRPCCTETRFDLRWVLKLETTYSLTF